MPTVRPSPSCHPTIAAPVDVTPVVGLSNADARRLLEEYGPNATPEVTVHPVRSLLAKFIAPVPCLLEAAIVLQLFLKEYVEAGVIGVLPVFNAAIGFLHEGRAQATIAALKSTWRSASRFWQSANIGWI